MFFVRKLRSSAVDGVGASVASESVVVASENVVARSESIIEKSESAIAPANLQLTIATKKDLLQVYNELKLKEAEFEVSKIEKKLSDLVIFYQGTSNGKEKAEFLLAMKSYIATKQGTTFGLFSKTIEPNSIQAWNKLLQVLKTEENQFSAAIQYFKISTKLKRAKGDSKLAACLDDAVSKEVEEHVAPVIKGYRKAGLQLMIFTIVALLFIEPISKFGPMQTEKVLVATLFNLFVLGAAMALYSKNVVKYPEIHLTIIQNENLKSAMVAGYKLSEKSVAFAASIANKLNYTVEKLTGALAQQQEPLEAGVDRPRFFLQS